MDAGETQAGRPETFIRSRAVRNCRALTWTDPRTGRFSERIAGIANLARNSSVVLAELWHGATGTTEEKFLRGLGSHYAVPRLTENNSTESGQILRRMLEDRGIEAGKLRDLHFVALIALTARTHGARLIPSKRSNFELIREYRHFDLEVGELRRPYGPAAKWAGRFF